MRPDMVPIGGGGGGPDIEFPEQTPEEKALQNEQISLLREQRDIISRQLREQQLLAPLLWGAVGIKPIYGEGPRVAEYQAKVDEYEKLAKDNPSNPNFPKHLAEWKAKLAAEKQQLVGFEELPDEMKSLRKDIERGFLDRSLAALRGELPVNPALLRDLREQDMTLRESLRKQLGPGFETSSAGIEALGDFGERREGLLEGSRRGDLSLAESLGLAREGANENRINEFLGRLMGVNQSPLASAGAYGGVVGGYNPILANLLANRQGQFGARAIQFQYDADDPFSARNLGRRGLNLLDSAAGAGMAMSTARVKKDIEPLDPEGATALTKLRDTPLFKYRYLWDDEERDKRLGPILELSPREIKEKDGIHVNMLGYSGLLHAGVKELDREVRTLREIVTRRAR